MSSDIRLSANALGIMLMRNNSGVLPNPGGRPIRYGLGNESPNIMAIRKSSDWIGFTACGHFVAFEEKPADWVFRGTEHEQAQANFIDWVRKHGGLAAFVRNGDDIRQYFYKWQASRSFRLQS